jgi:hypothetical protein
MTDYTIVVQEVVEHTVVVTAPSKSDAVMLADEAIAYIGEAHDIEGVVSLTTEGRHYETIDIRPEEEEKDE